MVTTVFGAERDTEVNADSPVVDRSTTGANPGRLDGHFVDGGRRGT